MVLKAACSNNPGYVDRMIIPFIRVIQRMAREHLNSTNAETSPGNLHFRGSISLTVISGLNFNLTLFIQHSNTTLLLFFKFFHFSALSSDLDKIQFNLLIS